MIFEKIIISRELFHLYVDDQRELQLIDQLFALIKQINDGFTQLYDLLHNLIDYFKLVLLLDNLRSGKQSEFGIFNQKYQNCIMS